MYARDETSKEWVEIYDDAVVLLVKPARKKNPNFKVKGNDATTQVTLLPVAYFAKKEHLVLQCDGDVRYFVLTSFSDAFISEMTVAYDAAILDVEVRRAAARNRKYNAATRLLPSSLG